MASISYFPHDSNARNDNKILNLRMSLGAEGYGIFFMLLERLREEEEYMSVKDYNAIAFDLRVDTSKVKKVVEDFGLFVFTDDGEYFYSESFLRRMGFKDAKKKEISEKRKAAANKRWSMEKSKNNDDNINKNANAMQMHAKIMQNDAKKRKGKERKEKESKERENIYTTLIKLLKHKPDKPLFISLSQKYDLEKLISELEKSEWLCLNLDLSTASDDFITNSINGKYRRFNTTKKQNAFHNFEGNERSDEDFEELARRKREKQLKELEEEESL